MLYQIVHSTAGRCRVRIPRLTKDLRLGELLEQQLRSLPFVTEVRINPTAASLILRYCNKAISAELAEDKLSASILQAIAAVRSECGKDGEEPEDLIPLENQWKDLGMPVLSLGVALLAAPLEFPAVVAGAAIAGAAMPWFVRATDSIKTQGQANIDLLDSLWMSLQVLRGQFVAPALKTVLVETRRSLRGTVSDVREATAAGLLRPLQGNAPLQVERDGQICSVTLDQVRVGDRLRLEAGQTIPVDGFVLQGAGLLDYQAFTGKQTTVPCAERQEVYALAVLVEGEIWLQTTRTGENTRMGLAARLMESMPIHDTQIGAEQAEFVKQAILPTVLMGSAIFAVTGNLGAAISPYQFDFGSGVPITISTTLLSALTHAARYGIYIRSGRALELLARLGVVVFDQAVLESLSVGQVNAIATLHQQNVTTYLLASGSSTAAATIASQCHIPSDHILHDETQQAHLVDGLRHHQKTVAVVGAGSHLTCADLTIAIVPQGDVIPLHADVVLLTSDLQSLNDGVAIARRAMEVLYQNTAMITMPNLLMQIGGGMVLGVHPVYNVIVNNGSAFLAEFLNGNHPHFDTVAPVSRSLFYRVPQTIAALPPSLLSPFSGDSRLETIELTAGSAEMNSDETDSEAGYAVLPANGAVAVLAPASLKQSELAKRLGVTSQALTRQRIQPNFVAWSRDRDPQGRAWIFNAQTRSFLQYQS